MLPARSSRYDKKEREREKGRKTFKHVCIEQEV